MVFHPTMEQTIVRFWLLKWLKHDTAKDELLNPLDWESLELRYWGQYNLPYLDDIKRKLSNSERSALIKSSTEEFLRPAAAMPYSLSTVITSKTEMILRVI